MRANNLTISINAPCNKDCPFCISKMTFAPKPDHELFMRNIKKAVYMARAAGVSSVMITSKGEPTLNMDYVMFVLYQFREFPTEIQTNGSTLDEHMISRFADMHLNTVALSVSDSMFEFKEVFELLKQYKINARVTIVLTDKHNGIRLMPIIQSCILYGVSQLTFRRATMPSVMADNAKSKEVRAWIIDNASNQHKELFRELRLYENEKNVIRKLPWGIMVHDIQGIAVTSIDYCIQESNNYDDIRSLIYHQDGHLYTSWDKPSSLIF